MLDARGTRVTALVLSAAALISAPAATATPFRAPVQRHTLTPAVDARHQALLARQDAGDGRVAQSREAATRAARTATWQSAAGRGTRPGHGGMEWGDALLLGVGISLGLGVIAGGAALGLGHRRMRVGHQAN
jgi:hypothetical protein